MRIGDIQRAWVAVRMENKLWWLGFLFRVANRLFPVEGLNCFKIGMAKVSPLCRKEEAKLLTYVSSEV